MIRHVVAAMSIVLFGAFFGGRVLADPHGGPHGSFPGRGSYVHSLPRGAYSVGYRDRHYWYHGGVWYAPWGPRWMVVAPPFGVFVPVLPGFYTTLWFGGVPYYYANDVYYQWRPERSAYEVVPPPPSGAEAGAAAPSQDIYMYPRDGQSEAQQSEDRYQCHRWASEQTHYDPTRPGGGVSGDPSARRAEYLRAMGACLEGRGYTVK
jgi:hypothetical protein